MEKLIQNIEKELKEVEQQGLEAANLQTVATLVEMTKELYEIQKLKGGQGMRDYNGYGRDYRDGDYRDGGYGRDYRDNYNYMDDYGRRGMPGSGRYRNDGRFREHLERMMDSAEAYEYGRERYRSGGSEERMVDALEKMMCCISIFIENAMDFAETPHEKEIIKKHIQKMKMM